MRIESHPNEGIPVVEAVDSTTSTPGQRPFPDGLIIHVDDHAERGLTDTSWQERRVRHGDPIEKDFHLYPEFNGERCGAVTASYVVIKNGNAIIDRYVHLANIDVTPTDAQPEIRGKGIGSALLIELEKYARRFRASRIQIVISTQGLRNMPNLPDFYRNRGFQLTQIVPGSEHGGFKGIKPL